MALLLRGRPPPRAPGVMAADQPSAREPTRPGASLTTASPPGRHTGLPRGLRNSSRERRHLSPGGRYTTTPGAIATEKTAFVGSISSSPGSLSWQVAPISFSPGIQGEQGPQISSPPGRWNPPTVCGVVNIVLSGKKCRLTQEVSDLVLIVLLRKRYRLRWEALSSRPGTNIVPSGKLYRPLQEAISSRPGKVIVLPGKMKGFFPANKAFCSYDCGRCLYLFYVKFSVCLREEKGFNSR